MWLHVKCHPPRVTTAFITHTLELTQLQLAVYQPRFSVCEQQEYLATQSGKQMRLRDAGKTNGISAQTREEEFVFGNQSLGMILCDLWYFLSRGCQGF